jgi:hypothetical protein
MDIKEAENVLHTRVPGDTDRGNKKGKVHNQKMDSSYVIFPEAMLMETHFNPKCFQR